MGAGLDAVHAKSAVHISGFLRHIELQLAATLLLISCDAIVGSATLASCLAARLKGEGRKQRTCEIELPQRAKILAEAGAAKKRIDYEGGGKVGNQQPGGARGVVPDGKGFVRPEEQDHQRDREPLAAQPARPLQAGQTQPMPQLPRQHEGARQAEDISQNQQSDHAKGPDVGPRQYAGQVHGAHGMAPENHPQSPGPQSQRRRFAMPCVRSVLEANVRSRAPAADRSALGDRWRCFPARPRRQRQRGSMEARADGSQSSPRAQGRR